MSTISAHGSTPVIGHAGHRAPRATTQAAPARTPVAWTAALGCTIAFIVVLRVPDAGIALKVLVDPLLHATSNVNVLLVLGVAAVACASRALQPRLAGIGPAQRIHARVATIALFAGLALCCTIALWLQLRVLAALELPWDARIRLFDGDANTVSSVLHNHMGKAALSVLTGHALPHASGYDAGHALAGHVPLPAAITLAAAFALACAGALGCWLRALGRTQDAGHRAHIAWLALLAACMLACLKAALDGGLLHYAFAPCLVTLGMAWHARTATGFMARRGRWLLAVAASGLGLLSLWSLASHTSVHAFLVSWLSPVATLVLLAFLPAALPAAASATAARTALLGLAAGWLIVTWAHAAERGIGHLLAPAPPGSIVLAKGTATAASPAAPAQRLLARMPAQAPAQANPSLAAALRTLGEDPLKPRRSLLVATATNVTAPGTARLFLVIEGDPVHGDPRMGALRGLDVPGYDVALADLGTGRWLLRVQPRAPLPGFAAGSGFAAARNDQVHVHALAAALRAAGLPRFGLMALADDEASAP